MKNLYILLFLITATLSCKSQTILPLGGSPVANKQNLPKPIHIKDINNIRDTFYGVWQGFLGNSELTLYIYKIDDVPSQSLITEMFADELFGYYIYKENGVEIINSLSEAQSNNTPATTRLSPFYGISSEEAIHLWFRDYGIQIQNQEGEFFTKKGNANITIIDSDDLQLQANFELRNQPNILGPYNYDFSIPQNMVLTKIASVPPPLD